MARKKRGGSKSKVGKTRVARSMKARRPKAKARRTVRGKYSGGK